MEKSKVYETIYQDLRSKILTGEFYPGQKLSEIQLSREHDCSRPHPRDPSASSE